MKKTLIALAALAVVSAASAQSAVTLSGSLYTGMGRGTSTVATADGSALVTNNNNANFIQFAGTEDLGGGLKVNFGVQVRFDPTSGTNVGNTLNATGTKDAFAQNVWLGASGDFGAVKMGRFTGILQSRISSFSAFGTDYSGTGLSEEFPLNRSNGMLAYISPTIAGFTVGIQTTRENNDIATPALKNGTELMGSFSAGPLAALLGYTEGTDDDTTRTFAASYDLGMVKPMVGYTKTNDVNGINGDDRKELSISATAPFGATTFKVGYRKTELSGSTVSDEKRFAVGANYALSKRTSLVADVFHDSLSGTNYQTGYFFGAKHAF